MKRKFAAIFTLALAAGCAAPSFAIAGDAAAILKQIRDKYDGYSSSLQDMVMTQTISIPTPQGELKQTGQYFKKGNKFRVDSNMDLGPAGSMKTIVIHDGERTTLIAPIGGKRVLSDTESRQYKKEEAPWQFIDDNASLAGEEAVEGRPAYVIETKNERAQAMKYWIDKESLQIVQGELSEGSDELRWIYSDFRELEKGFEMPFRTHSYVNGAAAATIQVESITLNANLDDALFDPEKAEVPAASLNLRQ